MKIQEMPFEPKCSDEAFEAAKTFLRDKYDTFHNMCNFIKVGKSNSSLVLQEYVNRPCHSHMGDYYSSNDWECVGTDIGARRQAKIWDIDPELYTPYIEWLVRDSHFSRFILNRDDIDFCKQYGVIISADIPSPIVQTIVMSCRYVFECSPEAFKLFNRIVEAGYAGEVAYSIFSTSVSFWDLYARAMGKGNAKLPEWKGDDVLYAHNSHRAIPCWTCPNAFKRFITGEFGEGLKSPHFRSSPSIFGTVKLCDNPVQTGTFVSVLCRSEEFAKKLAKARKQPFTLSIPNPFAKKDPFAIQSKSPDMVTCDEFVDIVLPELKERGIFDVV